jgi:hypothetical protein
MLHIAQDYNAKKVIYSGRCKIVSNKHAACRAPLCSPGTVARSTLEFCWRDLTESISRIYCWQSYLVVTPGQQSKLRIYISISRGKNYHADLKQGTVFRADLQVKKMWREDSVENLSQGAYTGITLKCSDVLYCQSQWPRRLSHGLCSRAQTLGSWVRIPLEAWMSVCIYSVFVRSCVKVAALRRAGPPSEDSYRLCKKSRSWKCGQDPTKGCRTIDR